ncbi:hypothetical protein MHH28_19235 [Paenibacillus sp. FSL K6-1217]
MSAAEDAPVSCMVERPCAGAVDCAGLSPLQTPRGTPDTGAAK